jgi:hypothetical protein
MRLVFILAITLLSVQTLLLVSVVSADGLLNRHQQQRRAPAVRHIAQMLSQNRK